VSRRFKIATFAADRLVVRARKARPPVITKVRIVGIVLLLSSLLNVYLAFGTPAARQGDPRTAATQERDTTTPTATARDDADRGTLFRLSRLFSSGVASQLLVLGVVMAVQLLARGVAEWVAWGVVTYVYSTLAICLLAVPGMLVMFEMPAVGTGYILLVLAALVVNFALAWWCSAVVREELVSSRTRRAPEDRLAERLPTYARGGAVAAPAPPSSAGAPAAGTKLDLQPPAPLLYLQGALDATGFGGWVQARGECELTLTPAPPQGAEVLAADKAGTWFPVGTTDPTSGRLALQLPAGSWYLLVRAHAGDGAVTIATVTASSPAVPAPGGSMPAAA
jgi:hypothetical protein